jgi:tetratricopeptide (TPR) repeat protein/predicted Ser/Thr protein kinase
MIGRTIDRFHVVEELGRGGMAIVWKARDVMLGRHIALKTLSDELSAIPASRHRFRREAEIVAQLEHRAIVPVYEAGESEGIAYLVMKLIDGETLGTFLSRRLPAFEDVLRIGCEVSAALGYAHARGVIHRDIKPSNIMIAPDGSVCVVDFGLARVAGHTRTSTGKVLGTPAYLAPETLRGAPADARSDIYSLGIVLYELLTGMRPFTGEHPAEIIYQVLNGDVVAPVASRRDLPLPLNDLIVRMVHRDPAERPGDADELQAILRALTNGTTATFVPMMSVSAAEGAPPSDAAPTIPLPGAGIAEQLAGGRHPVYLVVLPVAVECGGDAPDLQMLEGIAAAARAALGDLERIRVVADQRGRDAGEPLRSFARRVGANLVLRTIARFAGTALRIRYEVVDPEDGTRLAGGHADGSVLEPFALEDHLIAAVRATLRLPPSDRSRTGSRPPDPAAAERLAQALAHLRRTDQEVSLDGAISILNELLASEGDAVEIHAALARAFAYKYTKTRQRQWESRALQACQRAAALDARAPSVLLALGELHVATGRCDAALTELDKAIEIRGDDYDMHLARARALEGLERYDEAEQACRRAIDRLPDDWRGYHVLGRVLFRRGSYSEALGPWRRVTELAHDNAAAQRNLGSALFRLGRYDEALVSFRRCNEIRPDALAFSNLGTVLYFLGRTDECITAFEKAVALNRADARAWGNLGNACGWIPGHEQRMREALERALELMREKFDRESATSEDWARVSGWLANLDRRDEAEAAIRRSLEMSPRDVHCMAAAAHTYLKIGRRSEMLFWLERAVENGYGVDTLRRSPDLRPLTGDPDFERILMDGAREGATGDGNGTEGRQ